MVARILYSSIEVRAAIIELFSSAKGRRVAVTAFVGDGAHSYLPRPEGLELICWPKAGGTNPRELRRLLQRKVTISFADSLHMKVYWAEDQGSIVSSANLSTNALGAGDLKEAGVLLPPGAVDIDRLLAPLRLRPLTEPELRKLDRQHNLYVSRNSIKSQPEKLTFPNWFRQPFRPRWKLVWWEEALKEISTRTQQTVKADFGLAEPDYVLADTRRDYARGDWLLLVRLNKRGLRLLRWVFVDLIVPVPSSELKALHPGLPFEFVQLWQEKRYPPPPFRLDDQFRKALTPALREYGLENFKAANWTSPPTRLIDAIYANYPQQPKLFAENAF